MELHWNVVTIAARGFAGSRYPVSLLLVLLASACDCEIETSSLPIGTVGRAYSAELETSTWCNTGDWIVDGDLPPGISFDDDGRLRGTPQAAGTFSFRATFFERGNVGADGAIITGAFIIEVRDGP